MTTGALCIITITAGLTGNEGLLVNVSVGNVWERSRKRYYLAGAGRWGGGYGYLIMLSPNRGQLTRVNIRRKIQM